MNEVEAWMKAFEKGTGPAQTMDNMNWLLSQARTVGDTLQQVQQQNAEMQHHLQSNAQIVNDFMEQHEMVHDWQSFLAELQEKSNAVQGQETESLDVQEQAGDGEEMGEGDA